MQPGQQTNITLEFTMSESMGGPHDFRVRFKTNEPVNSDRELVVLSNWVD